MLHNYTNFPAELKTKFGSREGVSPLLLLIFNIAAFDYPSEVKDYRITKRY
jgi:hypothetical protein